MVKVWSIFFTTQLALCAASPTVAAADAEYAVRWDPAAGEPRTAAEALSKLASGHPEEERFEVRYARMPAPSWASGDIKVILRERRRTSGTGNALTYKIRSSSPLPSEPSLAIGHCPAGAGADSPIDELDVTFTGAAEAARVFSRSCTVESNAGAPLVPDSLNAQFFPCVSRMTRLKRKGYKVEEWRLPDGRTAIEVSKTSGEGAAEFESFRRKVVGPLVRVYKIHPLRESKTEMGSDCGNG